MDKHLHLHWLFDVEPPFYNHVIDSWKRALPDWNVEVIRGIQIDVPSRILEYLIDERIPSPFRGDLFRYWYMYQKGGVYVDFDTLPGGRSLDELLSFDCAVLRTSFFGMKESFIDNSLMASVPKHPFWRDTIKGALSPRSWPLPRYWFCGSNCFPSIADYGVHVVEQLAEEVPPVRTEAFVKDATLEQGSPFHYFTHFRASKALGIAGIATSNNPTWLELFGKYPEDSDLDSLFV